MTNDWYNDINAVDWSENTIEWNHIEKIEKNDAICFIIFGFTAANQLHLGCYIWGLTVKLINLHSENSKKGC